MDIVFIVPGSGRGSLLQEECCWKPLTSNVPPLLLHTVGHLRRAHGVDAVRVVRPIYEGPEPRAMIFSWVFGDEIESAAETCDFLIANPASAQQEIQRRFPSATVIPASDCFSASEPLDFSILDDWPHKIGSIWYQAASGCRHRCPYCPWDHAYQQRDPRLAATEILCLLQRFPNTTRDVSLHCCEITGCSEWLNVFCQTLGFGVSWRSEGNVRNMTLEDLRLAKQHGLVELTFGVEALNDGLLQMAHKGHTVDDAFRVFRWCQDVGVSYRFALRQRIGETVEQLDDTICNLNWMRDNGLRPTFVRVGIMDQWPGNTRWLGVERHGSKRYPRFMKPPADDPIALTDRWQQIQRLADELPDAVAPK